VDAFNSARAAISHIENNHCDLVIAAQSLPDMDGIQLLNQLKATAPDVARILLSNFPDKSILSKAINEAEVQGFLQLHWNSRELRTDIRRKAWNIYQLKTAVMQALTARELLRGGVCTEA
jgi:response regulator RpfG family c-di-GMP phosphodiesterase